MKKSIGMVLIGVSVFICGCGGSTTPDYPTSLSATIGAGQVYLNWSAVPEATGYNVYRGGASGPLSSKTQIASRLAGTLYTDASAAVGTNYYYQVTAIKSSGETQPSNEVLGSP